MSRISHYKIYDSRSAAAFTATKLNDLAAEGQKVLLLLSGGSAIGPEVETLELIAPRADKFSVTLADERFGEVGHADSNWTQLIKAGFNPGRFETYPILRGGDLATTTRDFEEFLTAALKNHRQIVGFMGIGTDGHTAGILPGSPAVNADSLAFSYQADYSRITTTPVFLKNLSSAYLYAMGASKWPQLDGLELDLTIVEQPAQILKQAGGLTVLSDYRGETV